VQHQLARACSLFRLRTYLVFGKCGGELNLVDAKKVRWGIVFVNATVDDFISQVFPFTHEGEANSMKSTKFRKRAQVEFKTFFLVFIAWSNCGHLSYLQR
jgi:hypothetical protein